MRTIIDFIHERFANHRDAAAFLGYSVRQYYSIRKKIERGESLHPRVESHLTFKAFLLKKQSLK